MEKGAWLYLVEVSEIADIVYSLCVYDNILRYILRSYVYALRMFLRIDSELSCSFT